MGQLPEENIDYRFVSYVSYHILQLQYSNTKNKNTEYLNDYVISVAVDKMRERFALSILSFLMC